MQHDEVNASYQLAFLNQVVYNPQSEVVLSSLTITHTLSHTCRPTRTDLAVAIADFPITTNRLKLREDIPQQFCKRIGESLLKKSRIAESIANRVPRC